MPLLNLLLTGLLFAVMLTPDARAQSIALSENNSFEFVSRHNLLLPSDNDASEFSGISFNPQSKTLLVVHDDRPREVFEFSSSDFSYLRTLDLPTVPEGLSDLEGISWMYRLDDFDYFAIAEESKNRILVMRNRVDSDSVDLVYEMRASEVDIPFDPASNLEGVAFIPDSQNSGSERFLALKQSPPALYEFEQNGTIFLRQSLSSSMRSVNGIHISHADGSGYVLALSDTTGQRSVFHWRDGDLERLFQLDSAAGQTEGITLNADDSMLYVIGERNILSVFQRTTAEPSVTITSHENGQQILLETPQIIVANTSGNIESVTFAVNGDIAGVDRMFPYQSDEWMPEYVGIHSLSAEATTEDGDLVFDQIAVEAVVNPNALPGISVLNEVFLEDDVDASVSIVLNRSATAPVETFVNTYSITATPGSDFYGFDTSVSFAAGESSKTLPLVLLADMEQEDVEEIGLRLHSVSGANVAKRQATVSLIDNEQPVVSIADVNVSEDDGIAEVVVSLSAPSSGDVSVSIASSSASAEAGKDFFGIYSELVFDQGESTKTVSVEILDDTERENTESIDLRLFNPFGARTIRTAASITIVDDD